jgi:xanthine dehydrogenase accessory factor
MIQEQELNKCKTEPVIACGVWKLNILTTDLYCPCVSVSIQQKTKLYAENCKTESKNFKKNNNSEIMFDILPDIEKWVEAKKPFALATVIRTWGSAPRPVGSALAVTGDKEMAGSVSGGCVEGAVIKEAQKILESGRPQRLKFGVSDEDAWSVGLTCGGAIHVWTERFLAFDEDPTERKIWEKLHHCLTHNTGCILLTNMNGKKNEHLLVVPSEDTAIGHKKSDALTALAMQAYRERKNQTLEYGEEQYFARVFPRKSQLLIVGAAHITTDLVRLGNLYDFETIVIDPRGIFANKTQFPEPPHQLFVDWPAEVLPGFTLDEYSYAVLLTHDPKIDDQALHLLLRSSIGYIGALGSSRTHAKRVKRLQEAGFPEEEIARIHAPVGVDIKAKRPKEIALSILAEIIKVKNQYM